MASWQDILFTCGSVLFVVALIPSLVSKSKPARATCLMTAIVNMAFMVGDLSLGLWLTSGILVVSTTLWVILFFQGRGTSSSEM